VYDVLYLQISSMDQDLVEYDRLKGKGVEEAFRLLSEEVLARLEVFINIIFAKLEVFMDSLST